MKHFWPFLLFLGTQTVAQSLQTINYNYLYHPGMRFNFYLNPVASGKDSLSVVYQLQLSDTLQKVEEYSISWERFESVSDKEGTAFYPNTHFQTFPHYLYGEFSIDASVKILAAKVVNSTLKRAWYFFTIVNTNTPLNGYLLNDNGLATDYTAVGKTLELKNRQSTAYVFYYDEDFPAASPPFTETQPLVNSVLQPDSIYRITQSLQPFSKGLYLVQSDTSSAKGISIRAEDDYPKFTTLQNLAGPLTYITTKNEFDRLRSAKDDKKSFDKVILGITGNAERAKIFMRNYFKRVEIANRFFTSYKEGWKTDRGMIYIIYGQPEFVYKFNDREVWEYTTLDGKVSFTFVRSSTLFDAENYVLVRKNNYRDSWLNTVDLIRNAIFQNVE